MKIVLIGGSGFLGQFVARAFGEAGHHSVALTRSAARAREIGLEKNTRVARVNVYSPDELAEQFAGAGAVVSMAGILNEKGFDGKGFRKVHVELLEGILQACRQSGVKRVLHVSALNAGRGDSHYLRTKGEAEALLHAAGDLDVTIFQPSVIFGPGDGFFNRFAALLTVAPVLPLACPNSRLQPVYAGDVARIMAMTLADPAMFGRTLQLGGPRDYSLIELVRWTAGVLGLKRKVVPLPNFAALLQAHAMDFVPGKPFSTDNYRSLQLDNVAPDNAVFDFGFTPHSIESVVPRYLGQSARQKNLASFRQQAGR
jgi:NADH dehydrogenase